MLKNVQTFPAKVSNGALVQLSHDRHAGRERESAADLFGWAREKILIFLPPRVAN